MIPFNWRLHNDEIYLAQYLKRANYNTAHVGIQHVTSFNETAVKELGFEHILPGGKAPDVAKSAIAFLERDHERPFFLNIGFFEPHRDENGVFKQSPPDDSLGVDLPPYIPNTPEAKQEFADLQGSIQLMDQAVGDIVGALDRLDLLKDTWVIFTTDHGLAMPRAKCTLYDAGIETALIMLGQPFGITNGRTVRQMVSHVDLVPTILDGLRLSLSERLHGQSYWSLLQDHAYTPRTEIFAEKTYHTAYEPQRAIRTERYKLIWNAEVDIINVPADIMHSPIYPQMIDELTFERPQFELYDLQSDPLERKNLAGQSQFADIERELRGRLLQWMRDTDDPILDGPISSPYYDKALHLLQGGEA